MESSTIKVWSEDPMFMSYSALDGAKLAFGILRELDSKVYRNNLHCIVTRPQSLDDFERIQV